MGTIDKILIIMFFTAIIISGIPDILKINEGYTIAKIEGKGSRWHPYSLSTDNGGFETTPEVFKSVEIGKTYKLHHYGFRYSYGIYPKVVNVSPIIEDLINK